jgi:hypothetical protein
MSGRYDESEKEPEFDWVQLHSEIHAQEYEETTQQKFMRKLKDNPFVPIGIYTTSNLTFNSHSRTCLHATE